MEKNYKIECACGCRELIDKYDKRGRTKRFKYTHQWNGRKHPEVSRVKMRESALGKTRSVETRKKIGEASLGSKHHNWKGGITPLIYKIRNSFRYRQWRSDVFTRDNFTCQECNNKGVIMADHIKEFSAIMKEYSIKTIEEALLCEELWNINNGKTLCMGCHYEKTWGRKMPTGMKWGCR
jgi:5-methylcytosine-specific restriction endonuclease McrA